MALTRWWRSGAEVVAPRRYRHIISLGTSCRSAHHIRRQFGITEAYPFDWWIFPLTATLSFLEDPDVECLYDERWLVLNRENGEAAAVTNERYGIRLFHEFPRENGAVIANFADHVGPPKERTRALLDRFLALPKDDPILFVKGRGYHDSTRARPWASCAGKLCEVLQTRYGFLDFDLLLVNTPVTRARGRIRTASFPDVGPDWRGDADAWTRALVAHAVYDP